MSSMSQQQTAAAASAMNDQEMMETTISQTSSDVMFASGDPNAMNQMQTQPVNQYSIEHPVG